MDSRDQPSSSTDRPAENPATTVTPRSSIYERPGLFERTEEGAPTPFIYPGLTARADTQSQTIQGDSAPKRGQDDDKDQDSNEEERSALKKDPKPSRPLSEKGKEKQTTRRRFTIEPDKAQDELILTDITEDESNAIHAVINSSEDFINSATRSPEE